LAFGYYKENFNSMILGRFIFAIGGESLQLPITLLVIKWFKGKELAFANV
jgi:hypothetical protein